MLAYLDYDPIVRIGGRVSPHGIGIALGFLLGAWLMLPAARRKGMREEEVTSLLTFALIGAIVGARLAYVINHLSEFDDNYVDILKVWEGGISLLGGFIGAILLALPRMRHFRLSFWKVMDVAAPGMALGVVIGRIGDLIVADHLGKPTKFFLGYVCPEAGVETASNCSNVFQGQRVPGLIVHQPALYDLIFTAVLLGVLLWLRRRPRFDGFLFMFFGAWYGTARIIEDFFRFDVERFGLTGSQWTSIVVVLVSLYGLLVLRRTPGWGRWDEYEGAPPAEPGGAVEGPATGTAGSDPYGAAGSEPYGSSYGRPAASTPPGTPPAEREE